MQILKIIYLLGSLSFVLGLKLMGKPDTAKRGNLLAALGMIISIFGTIFLYENSAHQKLGNLELIFAALIIGTIGGTLMANKVKMTAMPQMVSFFNGMGGACAALISWIEFGHLESQGILNNNPPLTYLFLIFCGLVIGTISFTGSMVAWGKLEGKIADKTLPFQQIINIGLLIAIIVLITIALAIPSLLTNLFIPILLVSLIYGVLFVMPIGGADMPVVISLLNSFTGMAAAFGGILYDNEVMLIGGVLVGSAGTILTMVMCKAMNRSLTNVIIGNLGGNKKSIEQKSSLGNVRETTASDTAIMMKYAKKVLIVPGYGLAVAQAQHTVHELEEILTKEGVEVKYAIHPVAGRMPGHMNVLLAESNVSYDKLIEMDEINPEFSTTDVVLVIGANDVVNPAAKTDPNSPIYGMPILEVENAAQTIVLKRGMAAGYAGIENELFYRPKTAMLFGDAKKKLTELVNELKQN